MKGTVGALLALPAVALIGVAFSGGRVQAAEAPPRQDAPKELACSAGNEAWIWFRAALEPWGGASGRDATVVHNYAAARLICEGYRPDEIKCAGFWFGGSSDEVAVVRTRRNPRTGKIEARFVAPRAYGHESVVLSCELKDQSE